MANPDTIGKMMEVGYKVPTYANFQAEELPQNTTDKILKKQIRAAYLDAL